MKGKSLKFQSSLEKLAYEIISDIYKNTQFRICLHYYIPNLGLSVDIAIPDLQLAFEIQGEQHRQKDHYFNKKKLGQFDKQQTRDQTLKENLEMNGWRLIELYEEDINKDTIDKKIFG